MMRMKVIFGSSMAAALMGLGVLAGSTLHASDASAQVPAAASTASTSGYVASYSAPVAQAALATATPSASKSAPAAPAAPAAPKVVAAITQQQAEQAALAANPGATVDHTMLTTDANGSPVYDVDFTNGGGAQVNGQTGAVITSEAAGTDKGGPGVHGGGPGGADQAALAAKATVTQHQAEQAALAASPGNTVDHSRLGDNNGTIYWDVDFTNGGGVQVNALTGAVITVEAAGTDAGPMHGGPGSTRP